MQKAMRRGGVQEAIDPASQERVDPLEAEEEVTTAHDLPKLR